MARKLAVSDNVYFKKHFEQIAVGQITEINGQNFTIASYLDPVTNPDSNGRKNVFSGYSYTVERRDILSRVAAENYLRE